MNDDHKTRPTEADLERAKQNAKSKKRLAWELLKQTRNPVYVSLRYGFDVETLRAALEKIPDNSGRPYVRSDSATRIHSSLKRARELLPETLQRPREPGEDDDLGGE